MIFLLCGGPLRIRLRRFFHRTMIVRKNAGKVNKRAVDGGNFESTES